MPAHSFQADPRIVCGLECPRYMLPLRLPTATNETVFQFILDTGSDVSLIPADLARAWRLQFSSQDILDASPKTILGKLPGITRVIMAKLHAPDDEMCNEFPLPCFIYETPTTAVESKGSTAAKTIPRSPKDLAEFERMLVDPDYTASDPPRRSPIILGRLGFCSKFRLFLHGNRCIVGTDDASIRATINSSQQRRHK